MRHALISDMRRHPYPVYSTAHAVGTHNHSRIEDGQQQLTHDPYFQMVINMGISAAHRQALLAPLIGRKLRPSAREELLAHPPLVRELLKSISPREALENFSVPELARARVPLTTIAHLLNNTFSFKNAPENRTNRKPVRNLYRRETVRAAITALFPHFSLTKKLRQMIQAQTTPTTRALILESLYRGKWTTKEIIQAGFKLSEVIARQKRLKPTGLKIQPSPRRIPAHTRPKRLIRRR